MNYHLIPSPCYVIDESLLIRNLEIIQGVAKETGVEVILAFKGFAAWKVFPLIRRYVRGAAASSLWEARLAYEKMKTYAHTYSPAYTGEEFKDIVRYSSHITFNSLSQYHKYLPILRQSRRKISPGLRINPEHSPVSTSLYNPCSPGSRLGVVAGALGDTLPEGIEGFHFHALCESSSHDLENLLEAVEQKFGRFFSSIKWINMGGGHLLTRKEYDLAHLKTLLRSFKKRYPHLHVILEPGAAFVWETGVLVATVEDIVENNGIKTAILNVSFTAHMPDCLEMPYQPRIAGAQMGNGGPYVYRMGGNSCLAGDFVGNWSFDKELVPGDRVVFEDMIHYTMVKTTFFNGVTHPSLGIWTKNNRFVLLRRFTYNDYKNKLS